MQLHIYQVCIKIPGQFIVHAGREGCDRLYRCSGCLSLHIKINNLCHFGVLLMLITYENCFEHIFSDTCMFGLPADSFSAYTY